MIKMMVDFLAKWGAISGLFLVLIGMAGTRFGLLSYKIGLPVFALGGLICLISLLFIFIMIFYTLHGGQEKSKLPTLLALMLLAAVPALTLLAAVMQASRVPSIHDASTDLQNPPAFSSAVVALREEQGTNSLDLDAKLARSGMPVTQIMVEYHKDIEPLIMRDTVSGAVGKTRTMAKKLGWAVSGSEILPDRSVRIDAYDQSFWFGFIDDIVIYVRAAENNHVRIDVRSVSRVGESDLGANAKRLRKFLDRMQQAQ